MMLDLDGFKALNDRFGHPAGDDLLRDVAGAIARAIRDQDTAARMGGDEFCVLAPETDLAGTEQLAERVLAAVATVTAGIEALGASAGVAALPQRRDPRHAPARGRRPAAARVQAPPRAGPRRTAAAPRSGRGRSSAAPAAWREPEAPASP